MWKKKFKIYVYIFFSVIFEVPNGISNKYRIMTLFYLSIPQVRRTIRHVYSRRKNFAKLKNIEVKLGRILTARACRVRGMQRNRARSIARDCKKKKKVRRESWILNFPNLAGSISKVPQRTVYKKSVLSRGETLVSLNYYRWLFQAFYK